MEGSPFSVGIGPGAPGVFLPTMHILGQPDCTGIDVKNVYDIAYDLPKPFAFA
jgi:hypothetical protein